ncbi:MAG: (2Fe-2S) ferredoxin domain-containing protein [Spirochaetales bacterium]|nr:(2Fe-2S) ferredoxin domain-containing protein [Spirochaetales bacterium]
MEKPGKHILVCASFRAGGEPQGICHKKGSLDFLQYMQDELLDRGMHDVMISTTGCLKVCDRGPAMVVYPDNIWYGGISGEEDIDTILDAMEDGQVSEEFVIS